MAPTVPDDLTFIQKDVQPGAFVPTSELLDGLHTAIRRFDMDAADRIWGDLVGRGDEEMLQNTDLLLKIAALDRVYQRKRFASWSPTLEALAARTLEKSPRDMRAIKLRVGLLLESAFEEVKETGDGLVDSVRFRLREPAHRAEALRLIDEWAKIAPESSMPWIYRGTACAMAGDAAGESAAFDHAVAVNPRDSEAWFKKAESRLAQGNPLEAMYAVEKALELSPDSALYQEFRDDCAALIGDEGGGAGQGRAAPDG